MDKYIGVDIGGSHITAAVVDVKNGLLISETSVRKHVNSHAPAEDILSIWANTMQEVANKAQMSNYQLGIAMPGPFDYELGICLMKNVNKYEFLYGINIKKVLAERLKISSENIFFRNDSEAFLEGEMLFGVGKGFENGMGITLGTGLGTSIFTDGIATDMGLGITHPLHKGVAEDFISTRWFINRYFELTHKKVEGVKQLVNIYDEQHEVRQIFDEFAQNIALFMQEFVGKFQPDIIVFGGNIAEASPLFFPTIEQKLSNISPKIRLKKSVLNENAALMGAVGFGVQNDETVKLTNQFP
ncbi:glucokinase [Arcicella aurantiaca]|uniref:Glucokinase n=1 Tax=Arcicella aurantiaca TaxID=591202 RepID=A0A316DWU3_9BACT|nr:ROK family protein [Arcicella aurantiaca]PWK21649.1 glucokinase [Arcicella aurantiaca]